MLIFNNAFEELNHDNENQQTEVHNDDADDAVNVKWPSKASGHLRQAGILLNLFPIKILLKQCKRLFSPLKAQRDNTVKYCGTR